MSALLKSDFLREIVARGFMHQCTDLAELDALAARKIVTAYIGFDATADSLHVGSLVQIMLLRLLQRTGHRPIVLMGGGTTKIGDPSGKEESRRLLSEADIASNIAGIQKIFARFLSFGSGPTDAVMANNADWLDGLQYIPFLRDYGSHFSVNRMLSFDSVKLRLEREQSLTFLEFNYMILQAYDFLELARRHECVLQLGGSDQWGNIVNGVELGRRIDNRALFGLTSPLDRYGVRRQDGRLPPAPSGSTPTASAPTTTGSISATPTTPTSAASCACSPICRSRRSRGWKRCAAPRSTTPRSCWRTRPPRLPTAPKRLPPQPRRRVAPSRRAASAATCRRSTCRAPNWSAAFPCSTCSRAAVLPPATARRAA